MMPNRRIAVLLAVATLLTPLAATVGPSASASDRSAVERLETLLGRLESMSARYERLERRSGRVWLHVVEVQGSVERATAAVATAELRLDQRVRTAYQFGPGGAIEALLGSRSFSDLATIGEYTSRTISLDEDALREGIVAEAVLVALRAQASAELEALAPRIAELRGLLAAMQRTVEEATALAEEARIHDAELEALREVVADAASRQGSWDLGVIGYAEDQTHLLELLGPTGGQTCDTPDGLVETGEAFEGYASWYGWEFGGRSTATGAIFDPRLFTAANRWLPFGTFLRVRHGDRCAIVLINDRGPYGRLERVIDLSMAATKYLGVGVSWVRAEILLPAESLDG